MSKEVFNCAQALLARREHSQLELKQKLLKKDFDEQVINEVLHKLIELGYQSDERYTSVCLRSRANKGYGPNYIRNYLNQRGISIILINESFYDCQVDWFECIERVWHKKFNSMPQDLKEQAKQQNFLYYRGFDTEIISQLFKSRL